MRIIAGIAKGMLLATPRGGGVRPTSDRVREAIFSSLGDRVIGADVLDLFAGTGAIGLEAASRGARSVVFVENSRPALESLRKNIETFRSNRDVSCDLTIFGWDAVAQLRKLRADDRKFSLIFADPPYGQAAATLLADESLPSLISTGGVFVLESAKRDKLITPGPWKLSRAAVYGDTQVSIFMRD